MTPERKVKDKVKKILDQHGAYYFLPATHGYGSSGVPDIVACVKGKFIGIECKAKGNTTTALQDRNLKQIEDTGGIALVINEHNLNALVEALESC
jgi:Holliday junction resolvase